MPKITGLVEHKIKCSLNRSSTVASEKLSFKCFLKKSPSTGPFLLSLHFSVAELWSLLAPLENSPSPQRWSCWSGCWPEVILLFLLCQLWKLPHHLWGLFRPLNWQKTTSGSFLKVLPDEHVHLLLGKV